MTFEENKLNNVIIIVKVTDNILDKLINSLDSVGKVYSCIVYAKYKDNELKGWRISLNISQNQKYNTLIPSEIAKYISGKMEASKNQEQTYVVCYMLPPLELVLKLYRPLIYKLADEQHQRWTYLEMPDLIQMCNYVICELYFKGYYIHKRLIRRSYNNYVLMHIRKDKDKPSIVSFEQEYSKSDGDDRITVGDMIPDVEQMYEQEDKDNEEVLCKVLQEVKDIVIDFIGPRQYDQLLREYSNKSTTNWSRRLMVKIKAHLFEMGISAKSFNKYYN